MKKFHSILFALIIIFSASVLKANFLFDVSGMYNDVGDAKTQYGLGMSAGYNIHRDIILSFKFYMSEVTENANEANETKYSYDSWGLGIEYGMPINQVRSTWRNSLVISMSSTRAEEYGYDSSDDGVSFLLTTGIQFNATQHIAPFVDIGYHYSYHTGNLEDENISGVRINVGIRFAWFDTKNIDSDY